MLDVKEFVGECRQTERKCLGQPSYW